MNYIEIPLENAYRLLGNGPLSMLSTFDGEIHNVSTVAWTTPESKSPPRFIAIVGESHKTHSNILKTKECLINIPHAGQKDLVLKMGSSSGHDHDKLQGIPTIDAKKIKAKAVSGVIGWLETKLIRADGHILQFEAIAAYALDDAFNKEWSLNVNKYPTLHHLGGSSFAYAQKLED